jgi:hypothetical protein
MPGVGEVSAPVEQARYRHARPRTRSGDRDDNLAAHVACALKRDGVIDPVDREGLCNGEDHLTASDELRDPLERALLGVERSSRDRPARWWNERRDRDDAIGCDAKVVRCLGSLCSVQVDRGADTVRRQCAYPVGKSRP